MSMSISQSEHMFCMFSANKLPSIQPTHIQRSASDRLSETHSAANLHLLCYRCLRSPQSLGWLHVSHPDKTNIDNEVQAHHHHEASIEKITQMCTWYASKTHTHKHRAQSNQTLYTWCLSMYAYKHKLYSHKHTHTRNNCWHIVAQIVLLCWHVLVCVCVERAHMHSLLFDTCVRNIHAYSLTDTLSLCVWISRTYAWTFSRVHAHTHTSTLARPDTTTQDTRKRIIKICARVRTIFACLRSSHMCIYDTLPSTI